MDMYGSCRICCRIVEWQPVWLVTGSINLQMRPWCFRGFLAGSFSWCYTPGRLLLPLHLLESNCYTVALAQTDSICQHLDTFGALSLRGIGLFGLCNNYPSPIFPRKRVSNKNSNHVPPPVHQQHVDLDRKQCPRCLENLLHLTITNHGKTAGT